MIPGTSFFSLFHVSMAVVMLPEICGGRRFDMVASESLYAVKPAPRFSSDVVKLIHMIMILIMIIDILNVRIHILFYVRHNVCVRLVAASVVQVTVLINRHIIK